MSRMRSRGLFSRLAGDDPSRPLDAPTSILANLSAILNAREGQSPASEHFGLIELNDIVHEFPDAVQRLRKNICETVEKYEPRLANIRVHPVPGPDPLRLGFQLVARVRSRREMVRVNLEVRSNGTVEVE